jgi:hypothetical protein
MTDENELSEYEVEIDGVQTTLLLDARSAARFGDRAHKLGEKSRATPNKAKTPENK